MESVDPSLAPFAADDAVFDPNIHDRVQKYITAGGDPLSLSHTLSSGYTGFEEAITQIYVWAQLSQSGDKILYQALQDILHHNQAIVIPRINANLAKDPDSAAIIKTLTAAPHCSTFMNNLANQHKQTAFYDVVKREAKLPEIGISSDVLRTPQAFISEIVNQFHELFSANIPVPGSQLVPFLNKVAVMCTYDEVTTVVSLRLFAELSRHADQPHIRDLYRKVSHRVREEAVKVMTASSIVPKNIARQYVVRLAINIDCAMSSVQIPKPVIDALVTIADGGHRRRFDREVSVLLREYGQVLEDMPFTESDLTMPNEPHSGVSIKEKMVLIQALCHPEVLLDLIKALYSHFCRTYVDGRPDPRKRRCLCLLLSYVSVFTKRKDHEIEEQLSGETSKQQLRQSVKAMYDKLNSAAEVCEELIPGSSHAKIKGKPVQILLNAIKDPLVARGIVLWAKECLHGGTDLRSLLTTAPEHLGFLEAAASHHEVLCEDILVVIHTAFTREYLGLDSTQVNQLRDLFMKTISGMLKFSMGPHVVQMFQRWWVDSGIAKKLHLRNFVTALFQTVSPPYSTSFAVAINEFLGHNTVLSAIEGDVALSGKVFNFQDETAEVLKNHQGIPVS